MPRVDHVPPRQPACRPLVVGDDPDVLDDVLRLAAAADVEVEVAVDATAARSSWAGAPVVVVLDGLAEACARARPPRRSGVILLGAARGTESGATPGTAADDPGLWRRAVELGAEHVVVLPDGEPWLVERLAEAAEGPGSGVVVAVVGGRGGAGASTLAAGLAVTAARGGSRVLLMDGDPLGGGLDLLLGGEGVDGLRWPQLAGTRGRVSGASLSAALPRIGALTVLSWDRGDALSVPVAAVGSVLAGGRRTNELVVVDLPRHLDDAARVVLAQADRVLLVVPAEIRACAAAGRVAAAVGVHTADLRLVVRGPGPGGLPVSAAVAALGLPLAGTLREERRLPADVERGAPPASSGRGPLAVLCRALLDDLHLAAPGRADGPG